MTDVPQTRSTALAAFTAALFSDMRDHAGTVSPGSSHIEWEGDEGNLHWHVGRAFASLPSAMRVRLAHANADTDGAT